MIFNLIRSQRFHFFVETLIFCIFTPINPAFGVSFLKDVRLENNKIGEIFINVEQSQYSPSTGVRGYFTATTGESYNDFLQNTLDGAVGLNWLQFLNIEPDVSGIDDPLVDPPEGGFGTQWADMTPWYWDINQPENLSEGQVQSDNSVILPDGKIYFPAAQLNSQINDLGFTFFLGYEDFPDFHGGNLSLNYSTFLVAEFPNKTYDILDGFSWTAVADENNYNQISRLSGKTPSFHFHLKNLVSSFEDGYSKILKLAPYKFSGNLSPGTVNSFTQSGLPAPRFPFETVHFVAWTNNAIGSNAPRTPDTVLGSFDSFGQLLVSNDNGGPYRTNSGSGFLGSVNPDGTVNLKVTGDPAYDDGNFDGVYQYEECHGGGSGGGGCQTVIRTDPHQESGEYELLVKLFDTSQFEIGSTPFQSFLSSAPNDAFLQSLRLPKATTNISEPTSIIGLLVLGLGGIGLKRNKKKDKE